MTTQTQARKIDLMDNPIYAAAWARQQSLQLELGVLEGKIQGVNEAISEEGQSPLEAAADRLLTGAVIDDDPDATRQEQLATLTELQWQRKVLALAITKQRATVDNARARVSAQICDDLRPEYEDTINNLAEALIAVADASERERELRERLGDAGVTFTAHLRPMPFTKDLADVISPQSMLAWWFKDGIEHGVIDLDDVPAPWRDRWFGDMAPARR